MRSEEPTFQSHELAELVQLKQGDQTETDERYEMEYAGLPCKHPISDLAQYSKVQRYVRLRAFRAP